MSGDPVLRFEVEKIPDFAAFERVMKSRARAWYIAACNLIIDDIVQGILSGKAVTGGALPQLEQSTIKKKGHDKPLIHRHALSDTSTYSAFYEARNNTGIVRVRPVTKATKTTTTKTGNTRAQRGSPRDTRRDYVAYYLQVEGVGKKGKKFYFFGISKDAEEKMVNSMADIVADAMGAI